MSTRRIAAVWPVAWKLTPLGSRMSAGSPGLGAANPTTLAPFTADTSTVAFVSPEMFQNWATPTADRFAD